MKLTNIQNTSQNFFFNQVLKGKWLDDKFYLRKSSTTENCGLKSFLNEKLRIKTERFQF